MTASRHGDKQICSISRVSFLSESSTPNSLPKHSFIMVYEAIGLRVDVYQFHLSSYGKLDQMGKVIHRFTGIIFWLNLFIGFIYSIWWLYLLALSSGFIYSMAVLIRLDGFAHWIYLLDLFIGFTYSLALYIRFGGFIYLPSLWTLVSAHTVFMLIVNSVSFSHISERHTSTFLFIYISQAPMEKIFRSLLRHHSCLIKFTMLQLHNHTLLIKLTNVASLHNVHYARPLITLTAITSLHHNCHMCPISKFHRSNIIPHCPESIYLISPDFKLVQLISFSQPFDSYSIFSYIWNTSKLLLLSRDVEMNLRPRPINQNPVFCSICSRKINRGPQQDMAPTCCNENCST